MGRGARRKKKWKINKRAQGWTHSMIEGKNRHSSYSSTHSLFSFAQFGMNHDAERKEASETESPSSLRHEGISESLEHHRESDNNSEVEMVPQQENIASIEDTLNKILSKVDTRKKALRVVRTKRERFREKIFQKYHGKCIISGVEIPEVLDAAHINPHRGRHTDNERFSIHFY